MVHFWLRPEIRQALADHLHARSLNDRGQMVGRQGWPTLVRRAGTDARGHAGGDAHRHCARPVAPDSHPFTADIAINSAAFDDFERVMEDRPEVELGATAEHADQV